MYTYVFISRLLFHAMLKINTINDKVMQVYHKVRKTFTVLFKQQDFAYLLACHCLFCRNVSFLWCTLLQWPSGFKYSCSSLVESRDVELIKTNLAIMLKSTTSLFVSSICLLPTFLPTGVQGSVSFWPHAKV